MSDLDPRLTQLVNAERQAPSLTTDELDAGWARLARTLASPLPPGPPDGPAGGTPGTGEPVDDTPRTHGSADAARQATPTVVPLRAPRGPVRIGVWIWPAAAMLALGLAVAWRWSATHDPIGAVEFTAKAPTTLPSTEQPPETEAFGSSSAPDRSRGAPGEGETTLVVRERPTGPPEASGPGASEREAATTADPPTAHASPLNATSDHASSRVTQATATGSDAQRPTPGLVEELALLEQMRSALASEDERSVISLGKKHRKIFPTGALREERAALEVRASCRLDRADAKSRRASFVEAWPTSAHVERIDRDCSRAK